MIDYRHILGVTAIVLFGVFYAIRHLRGDIVFLGNVLRSLMLQENELADQGCMAGDVSAIPDTTALNDHREALATAVAKAVTEETEYLQMLVSNLERIHSDDILNKFKNTFVELSDHKQTPAPHMLSLWSVGVRLANALEYAEDDSGTLIWVDDRTLYFNIEIGYAGELQLKVESNSIAFSYFGFPQLNAPTEADTAKSTELIQSIVNGMATNHVFTSINGFDEYSFEYILLRDALNRQLHDDFLMGFSNSNTSTYLFNPLAFGQAMGEGNFTVEDFESADVHGYFEIHESLQEDRMAYDVDLKHRSYAHFKGTFATSLAKSVHDTPYGFNRMPLLEFMFYWYQLGIVVRTMFVRKHPELVIRLHDKIWSRG